MFCRPRNFFQQNPAIELEGGMASGFDDSRSLAASSGWIWAMDDEGWDMARSATARDHERYALDPATPG
jgi:hypothetical protein